MGCLDRVVEFQGPLEQGCSDQIKMEVYTDYFYYQILGTGH